LGVDFPASLRKDDALKVVVEDHLDISRDDLVRANTECCVLPKPLGTKPLGPESH
jgi:hypothetical protein